MVDIKWKSKVQHDVNINKNNFVIGSNQSLQQQYTPFPYLLIYLG